ncbi:ABC transporter permease [Piscinibacter sakaiensis]|nr:ABC transporter permease subunit [Piscinibacter sakaiensis]
MLHGYGPALLQGTLLTLQLALAALALALLLGAACAAARLSGSRAARALGTAYTTVVRGVPDLVLMLLVYFGGQAALNAAADALGAEPPDLGPFAAGVATLGFVFGAYLGETFRGAWLAVPRGQAEAALALGLRPRQAARHVLAPQMLRHALPGLANQWLVLVKATALVSVIGLNDTLARAGQAAGATREPFTFYLAAAAIYLAITTLSLLVLGRLARRAARGLAPPGGRA